MELSNDVYFSMAVHQNTSSDLPDNHVNCCFRSEMVLQFSSEAATKTVL